MRMGCELRGLSGYHSAVYPQLLAQDRGWDAHAVSIFAEVMEPDDFLCMCTLAQGDSQSFSRILVY